MAVHLLDFGQVVGGVDGEAGLEVGGLGGVDDHSSQLNSRMLLWG